MLEFTGLVLPGFSYTLKALQTMSRDTVQVPFRELITSTEKSVGQTIDVSLPTYAQRHGFFDLSCLHVGRRKLRLFAQSPLPIGELQQYTSLDHAQAESLKYALTHRLALIQGPPGTGKSYTGLAIVKTLAYNAERSDLGPIICVIFTNHALDQLVEHLVEGKVGKIIRIGSRSQSEIVKELELLKDVRKTKRTKDQRREKRESQHLQRKRTGKLRQLLNEFVRASSEESIRKYLSNHFPAQLSQLFQTGGNEADGFHVARRGNRGPLQYWLSRGSKKSKSSNRAIEKLRSADIFTLTRSERCALSNNWIMSIRRNLRPQIETAYQLYKVSNEKMSEIRQQIDVQCLRKAKVIGMTTSGLGRMAEQLKCLKPKVVIMEEAGEVLEVSGMPSARELELKSNRRIHW